MGGRFPLLLTERIIDSYWILVSELFHLWSPALAAGKIPAMPKRKFAVVFGISVF
jgi:hypothetical protein